MDKIWKHKDAPEKQEVSALAQAINVPERIAQLLIVRGITSFDQAREFFRPSLDLLHDPFLMKDMDRAVQRLETALEKGEQVLVYGDYDVDGTTAVTLVYAFLSELGLPCAYYIPDRYTEGYGFSEKGVQFAADNNFSLIITLDCGIKDGERIELAASLGIDVVVCDHHQPSTLPNAFAVLDPKRPDCDYPYKGLSGCGVGFKLLQALCIKQQWDMAPLYRHLDLLTISIAADIVPLNGENRILAHFGLRLLQDPATRRPGVEAMLKNAGFNKPEMTVSDVVFILAPRINAAGRIFSGRQAVELLLEASPEVAQTLSPQLEENNNTRRSLDKEVTREALEMVDADPFYSASFSTVVTQPHWHKGVVGIVASRLVETYYKPAVVLSLNDGKLSGSARSIPGIDLYDALGKCEDLLLQYGGHTMAAGLSLHPERYHDFRTRFDSVVAEMLGQQHPQPEMVYEQEIDFAEINPRFWKLLKQFAPFGPDNMKPVFRTNGVVNAKFTKTVGESGAHLKLHVAQHHDPKHVFNGIAFELGQWADHLINGGAVDMLYTVDENHWNGQVSLQLNVRDIKAS